MGYPIKKNTPTTIYIPGLISQTTGELQVNPTIVAADCRYTLDGGAETPFNTTPDVFPAGGKQVRIQLLAAEDNGGSITFYFSDASGAEWDDLGLTYVISENQIDDIDAIVDAIKAKTDNLPLDPASESLLQTSIATIPTVEEIDTQLSSAHGSGSWASSGSGTITFTYTVTDTTTLTPIDGVNVSVYTEVGLTNKVADGVTDAFGNVIFYLDPGTYYFVSSKSGYSFANPDSEVVS